MIKREDYCLKKSLRAFYTNLYEKLKTLKKILVFITILFSLYYLIDSYINYDFPHFIQKEFFLALKIGAVVLSVVIYHQLFGKWHIHENNVELTKEYVSEKIPRSMKVEGPRGSGKDSIISGMVTTLRKSLIEQIEDEIELIHTVCFPYDFDKLNQALEDNHLKLMTNVKSDFFIKFIEIIKENNCFIKEFYQVDFNTEEHIQELYTMKKDPKSKEVLKCQFKYDDGITKKHFLTLLIRYSLLYIRYHYLDNFLITNQPYLESDGKAALVFSTKYINIQKINAEWPWPLVGGVVIVETEADAFYPNVGGNESPMKTGMRNFKAFFRHLLGEEAIWIGIGQKSKRTTKTLRELDDSFISIIEMTKVFGGEKRSFFLNKNIAWHDFFVNKSLTQKAKEKHIRKKSRTIQKITQLKNTGFLYFDIKVSRSDEFTMARQLSVKQILRYDKPIFENYTIKLCFRIKDSFGRFNSHYLELIAEALAKKSKKQWQDLQSWDLDLTMKKKHAWTMDYPVLDSMLGLDKKRAEEMKKLISETKKLEQEHRKKLEKASKEVDLVEQIIQEDLEEETE